MFDGCHGYACRGHVGCDVAACSCQPLSAMPSFFMLVLFACLFVDVWVLATCHMLGWHDEYASNIYYWK